MGGPTTKGKNGNEGKRLTTRAVITVFGLAAAALAAKYCGPEGPMKCPEKSAQTVSAPAVPTPRPAPVAPKPEPTQPVVTPIEDKPKTKKRRSRRRTKPRTVRRTVTRTSTKGCASTAKRRKSYEEPVFTDLISKGISRKASKEIKVGGVKVKIAGKNVGADATICANGSVQVTLLGDSLSPALARMVKSSIASMIRGSGMKPNYDIKLRVNAFTVEE
jgi:hypothetical protein